MTVPMIREFFPVDTVMRERELMGEPSVYSCVDTRTGITAVDAATIALTIFRIPGSVLRRDLVPLAKALIRIIECNVNPRDSDARKVRDQDQLTLYALMSGDILISFAYNVICNIWWYFDTRYRKATPHVSLISTFIARVLGGRIRAMPPPRSFERYLRPDQTQYKDIVFTIRNGRRVIRDTETHVEYVCPFVAGAEEDIPETSDHSRRSRSYRDHPYGEGTSGGAESSGGFAALNRRLDRDIAAITEQLGRQQLAIDEIRAVTATHFHTSEYYAHAAYQGGRAGYDPMDVDRPQQPYHPAPVFWRSGEPQDYPPPAEYQDFRPPAATEIREQFGSFAESIFGYGPPYPHYPPPPPQ